MTLYQFALETLAALDGGKASVAWKQALGRCISDCEDRPGEQKPRKVILELQLSPVMEQGCLDSINGEFKIKDSIPQRQTKGYNFGVRKQSGQTVLVFNDMSDDNIQQRTIDEVTGDDEEG